MMYGNTSSISSKLTTFLTYKIQAGYLILLFVFFGFLMSVTQLLGESPDYDNYDIFISFIRNGNLNVIEETRFEPGFTVFTLLLSFLFTTNVFVYGWIVAAAMLLKGWVISVYSSSQKIFIVVAIFYLIRYFPLHELTQLRAACGIALTMAGAVFLWKRCFLRGISLCALAVAFHMSTITIIPLFFLGSFTDRKRIIVTASIIFTVIFFYTEQLADYLTNFISVFENYTKAGFGDDRANPFAIQLLIDWAMIIVSFILWDKLSLLMKKIVLLQLVGMMIFYGAIDFPVIAHRIREMYSVFWIFFVAAGLQQNGTRLVTYGFIFVSIVFYGYMFFLAGTFFS